jgi:hypothetical protein
MVLIDVVKVADICPKLFAVDKINVVKTKQKNLAEFLSSIVIELTSNINRI